MKLKYFLSSIVATAFIQAAAQQPADEMIAAEKKFAATSKEYSTRKAFLSFVDTNCIGFNKATQLNVFREWTGYSEDSTKLTWAPEIAIMSASGTMGITSGPWQFRAKGINDTVSYHGHFATVWRKRNDGEWKAALDIGISYTENIADGNDVLSKTLSKKIELTYDSVSLIDVDKNFSAALQKDKMAALQSAGEKNTWISIDGNAPLKNKTAIQENLDVIPGDVQFEPSGYLLASSNDLLTVYGTLLKDGKAIHSYMRVWRNDGQNWKLVLMVIS